MTFLSIQYNWRFINPESKTLFCRLNAVSKIFLIIYSIENQMQKQLSKMGVIALLLSESKAAVEDHDNGHGGNAPCLESYTGIWENADLGYDPHAVHGIQANDGGFIAVGMSNESETDTSKNGFILKTQGSCTFDSKYSLMTSTGSGCDGKWEWIT